jgi:hypothetical protein
MITFSAVEEEDFYDYYYNDSSKIGNFALYSGNTDFAARLPQNAASPRLNAI